MCAQRIAYGLTGQIGAGKTFVGKHLLSVGCSIYNADEKAHELVTTSASLRAQIISLLGKDAFTPTGDYNRAYVAKQIFGNATLRLALEALIHPAVFSDFEVWKANSPTAHPFVFMESALLPRLAWQGHFQGIILVTAPYETRLARIVKRDNTTREAAELRLLAQPSESDYYRIANFVIENSSRFHLENQLADLIEVLTLQHAY